MLRQADKFNTITNFLIGNCTVHKGTPCYIHFFSIIFFFLAVILVVVISFHQISSSWCRGCPFSISRPVVISKTFRYCFENETKTFWNRSRICLVGREQIVLIMTRICSPGLNRYMCSFDGGRFGNKLRRLVVSFPVWCRNVYGTFVERLLLYCFDQCCGSMTFCGGSGSGSGSAVPCLWLVDPDPTIFVIDLPKIPIKLIKKKVFLLITVWRYIIFKDNKSKRSHKAVGIKDFLNFFAWW